jgi:uncharacterized membrane protein SirB2
MNAPLLIDIILGLTLLEIAGLLAYRARTGRGLGARELLPNVMAGVFLILGVRAAVTAAPWTAIAPWMLASLVAHLVDVRGRWRG